jgi:hypothetical protein
LEPRHKGKIIAIEVETGDYFLGDSVIEAVNKVKEKHPDKVFFIARIGYKAVYVRSKEVTHNGEGPARL